jgi:hypothetical protein
LEDVVAQLVKLHGFDVVLAIRLLKPAGTLAELADELAVVPSQIHASAKRLEIAGLVRPGTRNTNRHALHEFIEHGVRYAFPARTGRRARGIPTSHSAPLLAEHLDSDDAFVWPAANVPGAVSGLSVAPLYAKAPALAKSSPEMYRAVSLVDAFRVGGARERAIARQLLSRLIFGAAIG